MKKEDETTQSKNDALSFSKLLSDEGGLSKTGDWLRLQLGILKYWAEQQDRSDPESSEVPSDRHPFALPTQWEMTKDIKMWDWQRECAEKWLEHGNRGIAKVVTGAGKTIFAQHLIERLQTMDPELRVAIIVPTIVLMRQWEESIKTHSNLPAGSIGCLGGGSKDTFNDDTRILICVLNSASTLLPKQVQTANVGDHLLLIVDECHRATGASLSKVFETKRQYSLGLSATPEREHDEASSSEEDTEVDSTDTPNELETIITDKLGPIIYELNVDEAVRLEILSTFEIRHYGLPLEPDERQKYESLSRQIRELAKSLKAAARKGGKPAGSVFKLAQSLATKPGNALHNEAKRYLTDTRARKALLYRARARTHAVVEIISQTLRQSPESRILLFHESIDGVMRLYETLFSRNFRVTVDHSKLSDSLRSESIASFRTGAANILISARTLIEGFDVPIADVGIIAASSTSPRQRIQTIGRVLRRPKDGSHKSAVMHTLYMEGTVDDEIYAKVDWGKVTGAEKNAYFKWSPATCDEDAQESLGSINDPIPQDGPPRLPKPRESEVDWDSLQIGDAYPGVFEGDEHECDLNGNVLFHGAHPVANPQGIPDRLQEYCMYNKRFKVTPTLKAILCWDSRSESVKFVGFLDEPFRLIKGEQETKKNQLSIGTDFKVARFKGKRRIKSMGKVGKIALVRDQATDPVSGEDAEGIVEAVEKLERELGTEIHNIRIQDKEAFCFVKGIRHHLYQLKKGLEFK